MIDYDSELRRHHHAFLRALDVRPRDRALDIGCGAGQTTRDAARIASDGRVLGIDTSESALRNARRLTLAAGLHNVDYLCGDAAQHPLPPASFDLAISRFGTMFFADPVSAFSNIRRTLRPAGRLVMMVWQAAHRNEWAVAIHRALVGDDAASPEPAFGPSPFSLGDVPAVEGILRAAAYSDVEFEEVHEPVYYGRDAESAFRFVCGFSTVMDVVESQPARERERTLERLRDVMDANAARDGVWFDSRAWIIRARCG
ncbi:MAG: methyltransferase domain protein [Gemmatimonadetes bacterium]|nr:methyltransferase domain protein [Gemmatimonadota bacterium]